MKKAISAVVAALIVTLALFESSVGADARLFDAIRANDIPAVKALLASGVSPHASDEAGVPPLMYGAAFSSIEVMRVLLDAGAGVDAVNKSGSTALMWAAAEPAKVRLLLERGATPNARSQTGTTALMVAARQQATVSIQELLAHAALTGPAPAEAAVLGRIAYTRDTPAVLDVLTQPGIDLKPLNAVGPSLLFVNLLSAEMVLRLLRTGVTGHAPFRLGVGSTTMPLLGMAAFHGNLDVVRAMIDSGADANLRGSRGFTPLMMAAAGDVPNPSVVRLLMEKGAKLDERDENGMTALDWAVTQGDTPIARLLRDLDAPTQAAIAPAPPPVSKPRAPRDAVAAALARLQLASPGFSKGTRCISCHHQSLPAVAVALARARGVPVDATLATHPGEATLRDWGPRAERSQLGEGLLAIGASDIAYGLWQFAEEGVRPNRVIDSVVVGLAHAQRADGTWRISDVRAPLADGSPIHFTALAIRGLKHYAPPALRHMIDARVVRAVQSLRSSTPKDTQDEAFKLLGLVWSGASQREISEQARRIGDLQRLSGGWGQLPTMAPDAYATGQALHALAESGASASAAYQKGVQYLLTTQFEDGTWFVRSRAFGFQPYFDAGFPHGRDQFISAAATAWAAMALTSTVGR